MPYTSSQIVDKWLEPDFKFFINRKGSIKERMRFLMKDNNMKDNNMKDEYLGACLDYIRWGGQTTVMYELGTKELINFIQYWMNLNKDNLIWSDEPLSDKFVLPYIKHDKCPRNKKHTGLVSDLGGRIRCAHKSIKRLRPNFIGSYTTFDDLSDMKITEYYESEPTSPPHDLDGNFLCDNKELEKYEKEMEKFKNEEPILVNDVCYAILSEEKSILSLEKVLDRLNLEPKYKTVYCGDDCLGPCQRIDELEYWQRDSLFCPGHIKENNRTVHPFCGWTLAWYVQKWHEQVHSGQAPVFEKRRRT